MTGRRLDRKVVANCAHIASSHAGGSALDDVRNSLVDLRVFAARGRADLPLGLDTLPNAMFRPSAMIACERTNPGFLHDHHGR